MGNVPIQGETGGQHRRRDALLGALAKFIGEGLPEQEAVRRPHLDAGLFLRGGGTQKSFYGLPPCAMDAEWSLAQ